MKTEIGEYIVGAWLKVVKKCDFVDYNVHPPVDGREGQSELDVVGINWKNKTVFICEVATHTRGFGYIDLKNTIKKVKDKFARQQEYARNFLPKSFKPRYMFWSPIVYPQYAKAISNNTGLESVINSDYSKRVDEIKTAIKGKTKDFGNPFIRVLQIQELLRCYCGSRRSYQKCHGK